MEAATTQCFHAGPAPATVKISIKAIFQAAL
jgi:hypothetical protein